LLSRRIVARAQRLVEGVVAVATGRLGDVEGLVGAAQHLGQGGARQVADADAQAEPSGIERLEAIRHGLDQAMGQIRGRDRSARQRIENREFVPAETRREAARGQHILDPARHLDQDPVAPLVSIEVVDRLEAIKIQEQQAAFGLAADDRLGLSFEAGSVEQSRETIVRGPVAHLVGQFLGAGMGPVARQGPGPGLVLQPARVPEASLGLRRAPNQGKEVEQDRRGQAQALERALCDEAARHGQQRGHDEAGRDTGVGDPMRHRPRGDAAGHRQVEDGMGRAIAVAEDGQAGPDEAGQEGDEAGETQMVVDRPFRRLRHLGWHPFGQGQPEAGGAAQGDAKDVDARRGRQPARSEHADTRMDSNQGCRHAEKHVDGNGV
jgi:hypothetical protein